MRSCLGCFGVLALVGLVATLVGALVNGDGGTALLVGGTLVVLVVLGVRRGLKA